MAGPTQVGRRRRTSPRGVMKFAVTGTTDATVVTETTDTVVDDGTLAEYPQVRKVEKLQASGSAFSRAASYLRRRSKDKQRLEKLDCKNKSLPTPELSLSTHYIEDDSLDEKNEDGIDDRYASIFNNCDASRIDELRRNRAEIAPIICYEENDSSDDDTLRALRLDKKSFESGMQARNEALEVQKKLLGDAHPDVQFFQRHIGRVQSRLSTWNNVAAQSIGYGRGTQVSVSRA